MLIDPALLDPTGLTTVTWISPSEDGQLLAYGTYRAGDENTTLHLMEVDTRHGRCRSRSRTRPRRPIGCPTAPGSSIRTSRIRRIRTAVRCCFTESAPDRSADAVLFRQFTRDEHEKLSTTWGPFASLSRDGRWLVLGYWVDTQSNDLWLVDFEQFRATGRLDRQVVTAGEPGQAFGAVIDGTLYLQTTKGAPEGPCRRGAGGRTRTARRGATSCPSERMPSSKP